MSQQVKPRKELVEFILRPTPPSRTHFPCRYSIVHVDNAQNIGTNVKAHISQDLDITSTYHPVAAYSAP